MYKAEKIQIQLVTAKYNANEKKIRLIVELRSQLFRVDKEKKTQHHLP